jgi:hypothetical protein
MTGGLAGAADRATSAVRALDRAEDRTTAAVLRLAEAHGIDWTGPGAAAFRDDLAAAAEGVRRARARLAEARDAVADHAAALREREALTAAEWSGVSPLVPALRFPALKLPDAAPAPWPVR